MTSRSFFIWLLVGNMVLVTMILLLENIFTFHSVERQSLRESGIFYRELLEAQREYLRRLTAEEPASSQEETSPSPEKMKKKIQALCKAFNNRYTRCRLTVMDADGNVLGDSEENPLLMANHKTADRPEVIAALEGHFGEAVRLSTTRNISYRYFALPMKRDGAVTGVVRLARPVSDMQEMRETLFYGILLNSFLSLLIALALSAIFAWFWFRPMRELHRAAKNISEGDLSMPIVFQGPLELEHLATALERMRYMVSTQMRTIERQHESLRTIFNDLNEAIFAVDHEDRLLYLNTAAEKMFGITPPEHVVHLWSVVRYGTILSLYEQMKNTGAPAVGRMELEIGHRRLTLEVQAAPISQRSQPTEIASLLIVRDQTEIVRTNQMKAEFVANASHELRTPLATIRAAIDNLRDGIADNPEMVTHLLDVLNRHVLRLEAMVHDLLDLHMVENETIPNRVTAVHGEEIVQWVTELFSAKAEEKQIKMQIDCDVPSFETDEKRLHLILQNVVDNAIKFSYPGNAVQLRLRMLENELQIVCQDHGCGIPAEEQGKIFDRFYQPDSARTGDTRIRGIGLGMAIVKHALERLGGRIHLESRSGVGTTVTIYIPRLKEVRNL